MLNFTDTRAEWLEVGANKTTVISHEDNLRQTSSFFCAALDKQWRESTSGKIKLLKDETNVVTAYVDWLYSKTVTEAVSRDDPEAGLQPDFAFLGKLYVKIQDDHFADAVLCQILKQLHPEACARCWALTSLAVNQTEYVENICQIF